MKGEGVIVQHKNLKNYPLFYALVVLILACSAFMPLYAQTNQEAPPAIYDAMIQNKPDMVKAAIDRGDDVNALYEDDTLLCIAISRNYLDIAKMLIQAPKVDLNKRGVIVDVYGNLWDRPPLLIAAKMGYIEIVDLLLKKGADINARDRLNGSPLSRGNSALIMAAGYNHLDEVQLLMAQAKKPDVLLQNRDGKTAFWYAVENENLDMVKFLYSYGSKVNLPDNTGASVLTTTVFHKKYDVLDFLVGKGADINMVDNAGTTPLMTAVGYAKHEPREVVVNYLKKFLTFKPKLDLQQIKNNNGGYSALHLAARWGFVEAIQLLLDNGANINLLSLATGGTPLHTAAGSNNYDAAKYLIQRGAKLEIRDTMGATPLITAVMMADPEMVQVLVERGVVIDTRSSVNVLVTPLVFAAANIDPFKHKAYLTIINCLLDKGADINFQAANGRTALMAAAGSSDQGQAFEKATLLVKRGAKLDMVNDKGETALMLAAGAGNDKVVKLLIDKGADINLKNGAGESAMSYANRSGNKAIITLLESKGAKPDAPVVMKPVIIDALVGTWKGFQDGLPQAIYTIIFRKDSTFDFNSQFTPEALQKYPKGSVNPIIAAQKGTYTFNNDIMIWNPVGAAPTSMKWKLENNVLIIDNKIRLKKVK